MEWEFKITTMDQKTLFIYLFKSRGKVIFVTKFVILGKNFPFSEVLCNGKWLPPQRGKKHLIKVIFSPKLEISDPILTRYTIIE